MFFSELEGLTKGFLVQLLGCISSVFILTICNKVHSYYILSSLPICTENIFSNVILSSLRSMNCPFMGLFNVYGHVMHKLYQSFVPFGKLIETFNIIHFSKCQYKFQTLFILVSIY